MAPSGGGADSDGEIRDGMATGGGARAWQFLKRNVDYAEACRVLADGAPRYDAGPGEVGSLADNDEVRLHSGAGSAGRLTRPDVDVLEFVSRYPISSLIGSSRHD